MNEFEIENKIHELRSLIASDWTDIEERKRMYAEIAGLETLRDRLKNEPQDIYQHE